MKKMITLLGLVAGLVTGQASWAVQLQVSNGILTGATGVNVNGVLYDVAFRDGSCVTLFGGCLSSNFVFHTESDASAASSALLDMVFLDSLNGNFDSQPELTAGCTNTLFCLVFTPYTVAGSVPAMVAGNVIPGGPNDFIVASGAGFDEDFTGNNGFTYAVWSRSATSIPTPPTVPLAVTAALTGFIAVSLRKRR